VSVYIPECHREHTILRSNAKVNVPLLKHTATHTVNSVHSMTDVKLPNSIHTVVLISYFENLSHHSECSGILSIHCGSQSQLTKHNGYRLILSIIIPFTTFIPKTFYQFFLCHKSTVIRVQPTKILQEMETTRLTSFKHFTKLQLQNIANEMNEAA